MDTNHWQIALSTGAILDGNYLDFYRGQTVKFAIEFYCTAKPEVLQEKIKLVRSLGDALYEIIGEVIYLSEDKKLWVLDFGICAFGGGEPPLGISNGVTIKANMYLNVEEVSYLYYAHIMPDMPPLMYTWLIEHIFLQNIPIIKAHNDKDSLNPISNTLEFKVKEIKQTDAWEDLKLNANYNLICNRLDIKPTKL